MNKAMALSLALFCLLAVAPANAQKKADATVINSKRAQSDFALTADPQSAEWKGVKGIIADNGPRGDLTPGHRTEIRSRWTDKNLYLLFICPYEQLYTRSHPSTTTETNKLWEADVAEVFIGSDFQNIKRYTEFQVSPRGEWVDLFIDRGTNPPNHDVAWNSGYEVKANIDLDRRIWYGEMRIPLDKIDTRPAAANNELRINFYRFQGAPPNRKRIAWRPTNADNYHVPEAFGTLRMIQ